MKALLISITIVLCSISFSYSQINEFEGKVKIINAPQDNNQDNILIRFPDGTIGQRDASTFSTFQVLSISNDTIYLEDGGFVKLPAGFDGSFSNLTGVPVGLLDGDDDTQLTEAEVDAFTSNNGYLTSEIDSSITNELQMLSISNDTIYLENGGFVKVPLNGGLSSEQFLFELHKDLPNGLSRMLEWGYSPVELWNYGVDYDTLIGMNVNFELYGQPNLIFFIDTLNLYPFEYLVGGNNNFTSRNWACPGVAIPGADGQLLGDGIQNTLDVENNCTPPPISIFDQYQNAGPNNHIASVDEAIMIYNELIVPGYYTNIYGSNNRVWLSTEASGANEATHALAMDFTDGSIHEELKSFVTRAMVVTVHY